MRAGAELSNAWLSCSTTSSFPNSFPSNHSSLDSLVDFFAPIPIRDLEKQAICLQSESYGGFEGEFPGRARLRRKTSHSRHTVCIHSFIHLLASDLKESDQLLTTHRSPSTGTGLPHRHPPRKALRGGISKSIIQRPCQFLAINAHKMAPRTSKGLQERAWDAPTKGHLWETVLG